MSPWLAQLSKLIARAEAGEEIVIGRAGKPVARLIPYKEASKPVRKPGSLRGKIKILAGFDEADDLIAAMFRGESK